MARATAVSTRPGKLTLLPLRKRAGVLASSWGIPVILLFRWMKTQAEGLAAVGKTGDKRPGGRPVKHTHGPVASLPRPKPTAAASEEDQVLTAAHQLFS
jgi:hypothetical protein